MPDTGGRRKRGGERKLSNAHDAGQLVRIQCGLCNVKRWYQPGDLKEIFGDIEAELVGNKMSCERCGKNDFMHAERHRTLRLEKGRAFGLGGLPKSGRCGGLSGRM